MSGAARLDGWKAVADYLRRDARTAQRWHHQRGMPVHHVPGSRTGAVFAYPAELDQWLTAEVGERQNLRTQDTVRPQIPSVTPHLDPMPRVVRRHRKRLLVAFGTLFLLLAALVVAGVLATWSARESAVRDARVEGTELSALDGKNKVLWSYELADAHVAAQNGVQPALAAAGTLDVNGDGVTELVATVNYSRDGRIFRDAEVFCFSADGTLIWRYRPTQIVSYAGQRFSGPWRAYGATVDEHSVWVSFIDRTWWPSIVVAIGVDGRERLAFVNAGHVSVLQNARVGNQRLMLAGGFNNEYMLPAMAALDPSGPGASSPQTGRTPFVCDNCPTTGPWSYLVFPRSDVAVALSRGFATVTEIEPNERDGVVDVSIRDGAHISRAVYRLTADLTPQSVAFSDAYWAAHEELSAAGKIDHPVERCPAREGVTVHVWQSRTGWHEVPVKPTFAPRKAN